MSIEKTYIELDNVSFSYGTIPVLENISFKVKKGEYLGIIGPNGGGKTTLIKIILGLLNPRSGTVKIFGIDHHSFEQKYRIGYVPQRSMQDIKEFPATVFEVVRSGRIPRLGLFHPFGKKDLEAVERAMKIAGIDWYRDMLIGNLSGGERQRVFIARALASEPDILVLDEPTVGVDIAAQKTFYEFLATLNHEHSLTIIFVSHDVDVVTREATMVLCINHNMVCHGLPRDLLSEGVLKKLYEEGGTRRVEHEHYD